MPLDRPTASPAAPTLPVTACTWKKMARLTIE